MGPQEPTTIESPIVRHEVLVATEGFAYGNDNYGGVHQRRHWSCCLFGSDRRMTARSRHAGSPPAALAPRGLSRVEAAAYVGVSPTKFDELVRDGRMPKPKRIDARTIWDRKQVDAAFDALPDEADRNPWNDVAVRPLE